MHGPETMLLVPLRQGIRQQSSGVSGPMQPCSCHGLIECRQCCLVHCTRRCWPNSAGNSTTACYRVGKLYFWGRDLVSMQALRLRFAREMQPIGLQAFMQLCIIRGTQLEARQCRNVRSRERVTLPVTCEALTTWRHRPLTTIRRIPKMSQWLT